jgi:hypothetical protein
MQGIPRNVLRRRQKGEIIGFVQRYLQCSPSDASSNYEEASRHRQVATRLPEDAYKRSAVEAFARMTPKARQAFAECLRQRAPQQGMSGRT